MGTPLSSDDAVAALQAEATRLKNKNERKQEELASQNIGVPPDKHEAFITFLRTQAMQILLEKLDDTGHLRALYEVCYQEALEANLLQMEEAIPILKQQVAQAEAQQFMQQEAHRKATNGKIILPGLNN